MKKKRRIFIDFLLVICICFSTMLVPPPEVQAEQAVQPEDHDLYLLENVVPQKTVPSGFTGIYTVEDLTAIQEKDRSVNYILMRDLDLQGISWTPLKFKSNYNYAGIFDGNGHTIRNFQADTSDHIALFYGNDGTIKNLRISGTISVFFDTLGHRNAASVVLENVGMIRNCTSSVDFISPGGSPVDMGGIAVHNGGTVSHCRYTGTMRTSGKGDAGFGGIAYYNDYHYNDYYNRYDRIGRIEYCENNGKMTVLMGGEDDIASYVNGGEVIIGGIAAECAMKTYIQVCRFTGDVYVAGKIGDTYGSMFSVGGISAKSTAAGTYYENCSFTGKIRFNCTCEKAPGWFCTGGISGRGYSEDSLKACFAAGEILDEGTILGAPGWFFGSYSYPVEEGKNAACYYPKGSLDLNGSGSTNGSDSGFSAVALAAMSNQATFAGFDFNTIWTMGQSYPVQKVFTHLYSDTGEVEPDPDPDDDNSVIDPEEYVLQHLAFIDSSVYETRSQLRFSVLMEDCMDSPDQATAETAYKILNTINETTKFKKWSIFDNQYEAVVAELILGAAYEETDTIDLKMESQSLTMANSVWKLLKEAYPGKYEAKTYETSLQKLLKDPKGLEEESPGIYKDLKDAVDGYFLNGQDKSDAIRAISGTTALYGKINDFVDYMNDCASVVEWLSDLHSFQCTVEAFYSLSQDQIEVFRSLEDSIRQSAGSKEALLFKTAYQKFDNYLTKENIAAAVIEEGIVSFGDLTLEILSPLINTIMTDYLVNALGLSADAAGDVMLLIAAYHAGWAIGTGITNDDKIMASCDLLHANARIEEALYQLVLSRADTLQTDRSYSSAKAFDAAWMLFRDSEKYAVSVYKEMLTAMQESVKSRFLTLGRVDIYGNSRQDEITLANYEYIKWDNAICHGQKMHEMISGSRGNINTINVLGAADFCISDVSGAILVEVWDGEAYANSPSLTVTGTEGGFSVSFGGDIDVVLDLFASEDYPAECVEVVTVNEKGEELSRKRMDDLNLTEEIALRISQHDDDRPSIEEYSYNDESLITISPDECSIPAGKTVSLTADLDPSIAGKKVFWWSDDPDIADVDQKGNVTAFKAGFTYINAMAGDEEDSDFSRVRVLFRDVADEGRYYFEPVYWAVDEGITNGTSPVTFSPDAHCLRYQFVLFLWRMEGEPEPEKKTCPFIDVKKSDLFYDAVLWAYENDITTGTDAVHFSPEKDLSRAQVCTFLYRIAGSPEVTGRNHFKDVFSDRYYAKAVQWASQKGVTTGTDPAHFSPDANCTRAQTVTFLYRMLE